MNQAFGRVLGFDATLHSTMYEYECGPMQPLTPSTSLIPAATIVTESLDITDALILIFNTIHSGYSVSRLQLPCRWVDPLIAPSCAIIVANSLTCLSNGLLIIENAFSVAAPSICQPSLFPPLP
jgi:hypothetical protein